MSKACLKGALEQLPNAEITFDGFHVKAKLSEAVDRVRRAEAREQRELLTRTRYLWLRRPATLRRPSSATGSTSCSPSRCGPPMPTG